MKETIKILRNILLVFNLILIIILSLNSTHSFYRMTYIIIFLALFIFNIASNVFINENKSSENLIKINLYLYSFLLILFTFVVKRTGITFISIKDCINSINIIPFYTIYNYIFGNSSTKVVIFNIIGNLAALMPITLFSCILNEKYLNYKRQFKLLFTIVFIIEITQFITNTGIFDIDDFLLNIGGAMLFLNILNKTKIISIIKKVLNKLYSINNKIKLFLLIASTILVLTLDFILIKDFLTLFYNKNEDLNKLLYITKSENCTKIKKIELDNFSLYLNCVNIAYETPDGMQISIEEAIDSNNITKNILLKEFGLTDQITTATISEFYVATKCGENILIGNFDEDDESDLCKIIED